MLKLISITCLLVSLTTFSSVTANDATSLRVIEKQVLNTIFDGYDNRIRPNGLNHTGNQMWPKPFLNTSVHHFSWLDDPTIVTVGLYLRRIDKFDLKTGQIDLQMTFRQWWTDSRLAFNTTSDKLPYVSIHDHYAIWMPDIFVSNSVDGRWMNVLGHNSIVRIFQNGSIMYSTRIQLDLSCPTSESNYPFDYQECPIKLASCE